MPSPRLVARRSSQEGRDAPRHRQARHERDEFFLCFFFATVGILDHRTQPPSALHKAVRAGRQSGRAHIASRGQVRADAPRAWMGTLHPPPPASPCHPSRAAPTEATESPPTHAPPELDAPPPRAARSAAHSSSDAVIASRISCCAAASSVARMVETALATAAWSQSGFARRIAA